jgi:hypothetical protein
MLVEFQDGKLENYQFCQFCSVDEVRAKNFDMKINHYWVYVRNFRQISVRSYTDIYSLPISLFLYLMFRGQVNYPWTESTRKEMQELDAKTYSAGQYRVGKRQDKTARKKKR